MSKATRPPIAGDSSTDGPASSPGAPPDSVRYTDAERRGALLAAGTVVVFFGVVLLGWAVLGHATTLAGDPHPEMNDRR